MVFYEIRRHKGLSDFAKGSQVFLELTGEKNNQQLTVVTKIGCHEFGWQFAIHSAKTMPVWTRSPAMFFQK